MGKSYDTTPQLAVKKPSERIDLNLFYQNRKVIITARNPAGLKQPKYLHQNAVAQRKPIFSATI
jgi:hypothetical protein